MWGNFLIELMNAAILIDDVFTVLLLELRPQGDGVVDNEPLQWLIHFSTRCTISAYALSVMGCHSFLFLKLTWRHYFSTPVIIWTNNCRRCWLDKRWRSQQRDITTYTQFFNLGRGMQVSYYGRLVTIHHNDQFLGWSTWIILNVPKIIVKVTWSSWRWRILNSRYILFVYEQRERIALYVTLHLFLLM